MKQQYEGKLFLAGQQTVMTHEHMKALIDIGFRFCYYKNKSQYDNNWKYMFTKLCVYKAKYGDCNVPREWKHDPVLAWVRD